MVLLWVVAGLFTALWLVLWRASRFEHVPPLPRPTLDRPAGCVETVWFAAVDGTRLEGWLFTPHAQNAPVVIMAPGLAGTKEGHLEPYAWDFVAEGCAVLMFDYRCFGGSGGTPRHFVHPRRQQEDYQAALRCVRETLGPSGRVDASRIALWGSSFSGGTVLTTAAEDPGITAVIAQCPFVGTPAHLEPRGWSMFKYVVLATLDMLRVFPPVYIPIYGRPGEWVFAPSRENPRRADMQDPTAGAFWRTLPPALRGGWENRMLARVLPELDLFNPMDAIARVACPILFVAAEHDDLIPVAQLDAARERATSSASTLVRLPCTHFELYLPPWRAKSMQPQLEMLHHVFQEGRGTRDAA